MSHDYRQEYRLAVNAARAAGKLLMSHYGRLQRSQISAKSRNDFVTVVDKRSEKLITALIRSAYPDHAILGEEGGASGHGQVRWIIDPLDGTSNYIHHFPMFAVSIAVADRQGLQVGVVYDPLHEELFTALRGHGAHLNGRPISVSGTRKLADAFMATGIPFRARPRFDQYLKAFGKISMASAGMRRGGSAALDLAYVACGRFDGFFEINLSPWDIAAAALMIQEAGGRVTDFWGSSGFLGSGDVLASNRRIHAELHAITRVSVRPKNI
ncbi:MAG: Inositol-1-monophosphatase [Candidatus Omnitrophica bacterium]|nr:Inositol-1-monophosphatase [Candidatus Omnitrophota bacterium]